MRSVKIALILLMFLTLAGDGLLTFFSGDDLMNLGYYFVSPAVVPKGLVLFFTNVAYRPLGGAIYLGLYRGFGFDPLPFKITALALLVVNLWLAFRVSRRILPSEGVALLAVLLVAYNARLNDLYYNFGTVYELACYTFYYASLLYYLRLRGQDERPRPRQVLALCGLFVLALDAKEMAVTLPLVLLAYEVCFGARRPPPGRPLRDALRASAPLLVPCLLLMTVYAAGKYFLPDSLTEQGGYRPQLRNYLRTTSNYLHQWFDTWPETSGPVTIVGMAGSLALALVARSRPMVFGCLLFFIALFPVSVLLPKAGYNLYVPSLGLGLYAAALADTLLRRATRGRVGADGLPVFLVALALIWPWHLRGKARWDPNVKEHIEVNREFFRTYRGLGLIPGRGAKLLLLDDPYPEGLYDPLNLIALVAHDATLVLHRRKNPPALPRPESDYDYVLDYRNQSLVLLRAPGFEARTLRAALARRVGG